MEFRDKLKQLRKESKQIISDINNAPDYNFRGKEYGKKIASVRRRALYLHFKLTGKRTKFKTIYKIFTAIEKELSQKKSSTPKEKVE